MKIIIARDPYLFDTDERGFPTFTVKNVDFLNGILRYDSPYSAVSDKSSPEYQSSYAGIFERPDFFDFPAISDEYDELGNRIDLLYKAIESIDRLNSTHLASEGGGASASIGGKRNRGRALVAAKIREMGGRSLCVRLDAGDTSLVTEIASRAVGGKHNFSFATKFCSYASIHALGRDNFCIYDDILRSVLPYYAHTYIDGCAESYPRLYKTVKGSAANGFAARNESLVYLYKENDDYGGYRALIDDIICGIEQKVGTRISYADFDHMLWYYFKGSKSRLRSAMDTLPKKLQ